MTRSAQADLTDIAVTVPQSSGLMDLFRRQVARIEAAMAGQARRSAVRPDMLHDSGLTPDELTGAPSHDPALPFFMQAGFGRRDR
jgi:hypothetical protein